MKTDPEMTAVDFSSSRMYAPGPGVAYCVDGAPWMTLPKRSWFESRNWGMRRCAGASMEERGCSYSPGPGFLAGWWGTTPNCCSRVKRSDAVRPAMGTFERNAAIGIVASLSMPGFCGLYWPGAGEVKERVLPPGAPRCVEDRKTEASICRYAGPTIACKKDTSKQRGVR